MNYIKSKTIRLIYNSDVLLKSLASFLASKRFFFISKMQLFVSNETENIFKLKYTKDNKSNI
ncbi:hypothetical protein FHU20_004383 [Clostridium saccharobutylicum]|uniref:Uncharacterized protein n=1 Tax=Clostridium saccharobutylicum DSM 13864 TaxID=1345695 RepID=U5MNA5_CLOSA|nr:hypothetical protein [Clostridium saccharobutylicum]AGX42070.1 hypothetical protein CLSA_c10630 [Clostridium saccharobutylicum DSM 13864]MBA9000055.1 hypothetical protein [Clostridium saccharobutylicum]MBC2451220.1 hypothetical protein [Clostridium saccharobutylicum]NOV56860.1 hypothetical protein [Clostridium saccharobutylicum]NOV76888.1 hypothetical protein [Clostridium saccharobutylicum]